MPDDMRGGVPIHWREMGRGADPALLIHCSLAHSGAWKGVAAALDDRLAMQAFDLPGHGKSGDWDGATMYQDVVCDVGDDFLDAMSARGPVHLIGHSFGATAALRLAARETRGRIASLTLIEAVFFGVALADGTASVDPDGEFNRLLADGRMEEAARAFHADWGDGRDWAAMEPHQRDALISRMPLIAAVQVSNNGDPEGILARGLIAAMPVPTLLIEGAESPPHITRIHEGLDRRIPDSRRVVIAGAAHMAPITHPVPVAASIRGFLDQP
ncbi:alpha/beta fold hydrolase [Pseudooceanicola aestuarii]|uniref:alpha/beta fold hydrolase n=1 Tax=Pseudooceanicola aestuarii TaxID=2697319 RepID=UPI0013D47925|nr:alpha/beta hydrolase [Pseudooceanicola aestuarii]